MYVEDTVRCPYCRGDMLKTEHMETGARTCTCIACGVYESWSCKAGSAYYSHVLKRPTAFITVDNQDDTVDCIPYYGKHPYKFLQGWKKKNSTLHATGVVYNKKHHKLTTVFGQQPTIYPDSYYEDEEL